MSCICMQIYGRSGRSVHGTDCKQDFPTLTVAEHAGPQSVPFHSLRCLAEALELSLYDLTAAEN